MDSTERKGGRRSALWNHFCSLPNGEKATCGYCKSDISIKGGALSNLKKHLKAKHIKAYRQVHCGANDPLIDETNDDSYAETSILDTDTTIIVDEEKELPKYSIEIKNVSTDEHNVTTNEHNVTKRSLVWMHYSLSSTFPNKANCDHCHIFISFKGGSTANLRKHLRVRHPKVYKEIAVRHPDEIEEVNNIIEEENNLAAETDNYPLNYYASKKGNKRRRTLNHGHGNESSGELPSSGNGIGAFIKFIISELNLLKDESIMLETRWKIQESIMAGRRQQLSVSTEKAKIIYAQVDSPAECPAEVATYILSNAEPSSEM